MAAAKPAAPSALTFDNAFDKAEPGTIVIQSSDNVCFRFPLWLLKAQSHFFRDLPGVTEAACTTDNGSVVQLPFASADGLRLVLGRIRASFDEAECPVPHLSIFLNPILDAAVRIIDACGLRDVGRLLSWAYLSSASVSPLQVYVLARALGNDELVAHLQERLFRYFVAERQHTAEHGFWVYDILPDPDVLDKFAEECARYLNGVDAALRALPRKAYRNAGNEFFKKCRTNGGCPVRRAYGSIRSVRSAVADLVMQDLRDGLAERSWQPRIQRMLDCVGCQQRFVRDVEEVMARIARPRLL